MRPVGFLAKLRLLSVEVLHKLHSNDPAIKENSLLLNLVLTNNKRVGAQSNQLPVQKYSILIAIQQMISSNSHMTADYRLMINLSTFSQFQMRFWPQWKCHYHQCIDVQVMAAVLLSRLTVFCTWIAVVI